MRIYCCGVFDLAHYGHFEFLKKVAEHGELIVGIHSDKDCENYKRVPILNENERALTLTYLSFVKKIIVGAPLVTTSEFLEKNNLDLVAIPEEYADGKGSWYDQILSKGNYVIIGRTEGISTTQIINKAKKY